MTRRRSPHPGPLLAAALALALGGCISLLPKSKPAQLYRFEANVPAGVLETPASGPRVSLVLSPPGFPRATAGDQILAVTGEETAYVAGARWVAPAQVLFEESLRRAFGARAARARLVTRGELAAADAFLRLDVSEFEARYSQPGAIPTVRIVMRALLQHKNGAFSAARTFAAEVPAADNRISAIVAAYSVAMEKVTTELVSWTDANAGAAAEPGAVVAPPAAARTTSSTTTTSTTTVPRPNTR